MKYIVIEVESQAAMGYLISELEDNYPCIVSVKEVVREEGTDVYHD